MKILTQFKYALLLLLLVAENIQATVWTVETKDDTEDGNSLRHILKTQAQSGDTVRFADNLAMDTITLTSNLYPFGTSSSALKDKALTLFGNGVTIATSSTIAFGNNANSTMTKLEIENIHFINRMPTIAAAKGDIRNCTFAYTATSSTTTNFNLSGNLTFEGCAFTMEEKMFYIQNNGINLAVSFVSCTFVKAAGTYTSDDYFLFKSATASNLSATMTNCVVMDYSTAKPTFSNRSLITSKGYNVIQEGIATPSGIWTKAAGDTIMPADATPPLIFDTDTFKVPISSPAYRHLPPQSQWEDIPALSGVEFPQNDLAGEGINYSCKTHSGAWQAVYLTENEEEPAAECGSTTVTVTHITLTPPAGTIYTETSSIYTVSALVEPASDGVSQAVTWISSNTDVAGVTADGINKCTITPLLAGTTTITATSVANTSVTESIEITVVGYIHVTDIKLEVDTIRSTHHLTQRLYPPVINPTDALNKAFTWTLEDPQDVVAHTIMGGVYTIQGKEAGTAKLIATAADGSIADTCVLIFTEPNYTDGVFMLTEGNYPGNGRLNFLHPDGTWDYDLYTAFNNPTNFQTPARDLGVTSQFGTIYGDKFYVTSKQGTRFVIFDPVTIEQHREFWDYPSGDGRFFLGVDEHTGYISSSNGIHIIDLDNLCSVTGGHRGSDKAVQTLPATTVEGTQSGSGLYTGQVGTMIRVGERVFAVHQSQGILVINARTHEVETTLSAYHFAVLTQSYDGYLWAGATVTEATGELSVPTEEGGQGVVDDVHTYNALIRIDPWTLEEKAFPLPDGIGSPPSTWGAWQADPFCGSPKENALYWIDQRQIHRYDITSGQVTTVFDALDVSACPLPSEFPEGRWNMYGPSFRIHPISGDLYVWITLYNLSAKNEQRQVWEVHRINSVTGEKLGIYPLKRTYWWPSLFIFPDNEDPVVNTSFPTVTLNEAHRYDTLSLRPLVTDADNMSAAIVKTIEAIGNPTLVSALIRHDSLFITPLKDLTAPQTTTVSLKFNSNGKVVTQDLSVTVEPGAIAHPVTGITLNRATAAIAVGQTLQLAATVNPADADNKEMRWTSNLPYIASVDNNGLVTAHLAPATVTITATTVEGGFKAVCDITVEPPAVNNPFALNCTDTTIAVGDSVQLSITESEQYTKLVWHSLNEAVATVSDSGMVTAVAPGTAKIMVEDPESDRFNVCMITVPVPYYIHLDHTVLIMNEGDMVTVKATISPPDSTVNWSTGDGTVADVTDKGLVIAGVPGNAIIVAQLGNTQVYDTCKVTVRDIPFTVEVIEVGSDRATLKFPRVFSANCYPVYLYEGVSDSPVSVDTVKATAQSPNIFNFTQLKPDFFYEVAVAVISTVNGVDETVSTTTRVQFNTKVSTSIGGIDATNAAAWYSGGVLRLRNLKGYAGHVTSVTGQSLKVLRVNNDEETFAVSLSPGIYILTAQKEGDRKTFKFVVH